MSHTGRIRKNGTSIALERRGVRGRLRDALLTGILGATLFMRPTSASAASSPKQGETVILMHGILGRPLLMKRIEWALQRAGYAVINIDYAGRKERVEQTAADLAAVVRSVDPSTRIHFIRFSLGSLVIRYYLSHDPPPNAGRFVMIAPPNHGSERADRLYAYRWFRLLYGDQAITQLLASNRSFYAGVGIPSVPFGILAGGRCDDEGISRDLPGDNDGAVSLQSSRLEGAADFYQIPGQHTALLFKQETSDQVVAFLSLGQFSHRGGAACEAERAGLHSRIP